MKTPICDFVSQYVNNDPLRLHMPGHKGKNILGFEAFDISEVEGADSLYEASGIIKESELNASELFGCDTFYSTEGSSLCIRTMLYLATVYAKEQGKSCRILASRNAHKTFVSSVVLLDLDVVWIKPDAEDSYLSCFVNSESLEKQIEAENPVAVYLTSPDYLGNITDIKAIAKICKKHNTLLLVDNAHGAYLKFLPESLHPVDLGADLCCDSAHKTLPVLTGGAYLHINSSVSEFITPMVKSAMALFGSTSPSYLILQSLDAANKYISDEYKSELSQFISKAEALKESLRRHGYTLIENEPLKITISTKDYGYTGSDFAAILKNENIICEFCDPDFVVFMLTVNISDEDICRLRDILISIPRLCRIDIKPPAVHIPRQVMSVRDAALSPMETISTKAAKGRILAMTTVGCPPAVPVIICAEEIDEKTLECFEYYNITECIVVK